MDFKPISLVLLPLPAQGHLNQLLHLAHHIAGHTIAVHYVGSASHNRQARERSFGWDPTTMSNLHFHDFPLPPYSTPPPNPNSSIKFPTHLQPTFNAALGLASPLTSLLKSLSSISRRVVLIHDSTMSFAVGVASSVPNVESYVFHSVSAYTMLFFSLQTRQEAIHDSTLTFKDCFSDEFLEFVRAQHKMTAKDHGRILNTCREIEGTFVERLAMEPNWQGQKVFALGPLNPIKVPGNRRQPRHECLDWLDQQPERSVVYVSFGTTSSLPKEQIVELAKGLELSGQRYLWVLREADRGDIYAAAATDNGIDVGSEGIIKSTSGRGVVVRGWAPQLEVLGHGATAGFLSHCGWNSCMESMSMGVPILTWPMHSDQPRNAKLVADVLRVGIAVREWGRRNEVLVAEAIRGAIAKLLFDDEGKKVARRAKEVGEVIRECGTKEEELQAFIAHISRRDDNVVDVDDDYPVDDNNNNKVGLI